MTRPWRFYACFVVSLAMSSLAYLGLVSLPRSHRSAAYGHTGVTVSPSPQADPPLQPGPAVDHSLGPATPLKTVGSGLSSLREFQSHMEEIWRMDAVLLNQTGNIRPPNLTTHNCTKLILGKDGQQSSRMLPAVQVNSSLTNVTSSRPTKSRVAELLALTQNCTGYVLNTGFRFARISEEEMSFPLAFSVLVYKDLDQVERLLRALYRPHNVYCVHVDRKSHEDFQSGLRLIVGCLPNVFVLETSVDVLWAKYSVLEPEIECMRRLLAHRAAWRYFINLTGQEFPLKTNKELVRIVKAFRGANDIGGTHDESFNFRWKKQQPVPYNLTMSKGDVHMLASRGYVDYIINSPVAQALLEWLKDTFIPDETFFSTMNHNPKLGVPGSYMGTLDSVVKNPMRSFKYWDFNPEEKKQCRGKWLRNVCNFGVGDLPSLTSTPLMIANKFSYDYQPLAYDCLEKWYFDKVELENRGEAKPLNLSLYENSDIVKHRYKGPVLIWE